MTDQVRYARALHILATRFADLGAQDPDDEARDYLRRLIADGWTTRQPIETDEPSTGPRATNPAEHVARLRAELRRPTTKEPAS